MWTKYWGRDGATLIKALNFGNRLKAELGDEQNKKVESIIFNRR